MFLLLELMQKLQHQQQRSGSTAALLYRTRTISRFFIERQLVEN